MSKRLTRNQMDEDIRLIDRYLGGDEYAVQELVMKYQKKIYALNYRMTGDVEDAKDLTQKAFIKALGNLRGFKRRSAFYTWLYAVALNVARSHLKARGSAATLSLNEFAVAGGKGGPGGPGGKGGAGQLGGLVEAERRGMVKDALSSLPVRQREAVVLRAYQGMTSKEASSVMGCTEGAVKAHYHSAVRNLRETLKERGYEIRA